MGSYKRLDIIEWNKISVNLVWRSVFFLILDFVSENSYDVGIKGRFGRGFWFCCVGSGSDTRRGKACAWHSRGSNERCRSSLERSNERRSHCEGWRVAPLSLLPSQYHHILCSVLLFRRVGLRPSTFAILTTYRVDTILWNSRNILSTEIWLHYTIKPYFRYTFWNAKKITMKSYFHYCNIRV